MDKLTLGYVHPLIPFRDDLFGRLESEFDQFFSEFLNPSRSKKISSRAYPKVDMFSSGNDFFIEAAIPGLNRNDIEIVIEGNQLTINGQLGIDHETVDKDRNFFLKELKKSKFSRTFTLPDHYPEPEAKLIDGILKLTFKDVLKNSSPQKKLIDIK